MQLLDPALAAAVQLTGSMQVIVRDHFETVRLAGAVECPRWLLPEPGVPLEGRLGFVLSKNPSELSLSQFQAALRRGGPLVDLSGGFRVDLVKPDGGVNLQLHSSLIDLDKLIELFQPIAAAAQARHEAENKKNEAAATAEAESVKKEKRRFRLWKRRRRRFWISAPARWMWRCWQTKSACRPASPAR